MSKLLNQKVQCTERPGEIGVISFYNPDTGEMNVIYGDEVIITHISKCKIVK